MSYIPSQLLPTKEIPIVIQKDGSVLFLTRDNGICCAGSNALDRASQRGGDKRTAFKILEDEHTQLDQAFLAFKEF